MRRFISLLLALPLAACVSTLPADRHQEICVVGQGRLDPKLAVRPTAPSVSKVVRYTDYGEFVDRCEYTDLMYELKSPGPQIVVVYVHGWKHNAEEFDSDLDSFSEVVDSVYSRDPATNRHRVVGVYVAWRGKSTWLPLVKEFTFWGRMRAADRLSQSAAVTKLLAAIDSVRAERANPADVHVYIGHSFGARVLYNAVAQVLIREAQMKHPGASNGPFGVIRGVGDLVVLLNPAFEASLFTVFHSLSRQEYPFNDAQHPVLVSISSSTDRATKLAFPIGQVLGRNLAPQRRVTLGNFAHYRTHQLIVRPAPCQGMTLVTPVSAECCSTRACLVQLPTAPKHGPFISAVADPGVIDGHGDVWNPVLQDFLIELVRDARGSDHNSGAESR